MLQYVALKVFITKLSSSIHCIIQQVTRIQKYVFLVCLRTEIRRNKESLYPTVVSRKYMRVILFDSTQAPTVTGEQVLKKILEKLQWTTEVSSLV